MVVLHTGHDQLRVLNFGSWPDHRPSRFAVLACVTSIVQAFSCAVNAGATSVDSVQFQAEDAVVLAARLQVAWCWLLVASWSAVVQALRNAVSDASAQATAVLGNEHAAPRNSLTIATIVCAGVMGLALGTPVSVNVNYVAPPPPRWVYCWLFSLLFVVIPSCCCRTVAAR